MLVQGPKQPRNDINLYRQLLKEELDTLWAEQRGHHMGRHNRAIFPYESRVDRNGVGLPQLRIYRMPGVPQTQCLRQVHG